MSQEWMFEFATIRRLSANIFEMTPLAGVQIDRKVIDAMHCFYDEHGQPFSGLLVSMQNSYSYTFEALNEMSRHPHLSHIARLAVDESKRTFADYVSELERDLGFQSKSFSHRADALAWLENSLGFARTQAQVSTMCHPSI